MEDTEAQSLLWRSLVGDVAQHRHEAFGCQAQEKAGEQCCPSCRVWSGQTRRLRTQVRVEEEALILRRVESPNPHQDITALPRGAREGKEEVWSGTEGRVSF